MDYLFGTASLARIFISNSIQSTPSSLRETLVLKSGAGNIVDPQALMEEDSGGRLS